MRKRKETIPSRSLSSILCPESTFSFVKPLDSKELVQHRAHNVIQVRLISQVFRANQRAITQETYCSAATLATLEGWNCLTGKQEPRQQKKSKQSTRESQSFDAYNRSHMTFTIIICTGRWSAIEYEETIKNRGSFASTCIPNDLQARDNKKKNFKQI